MRSGSIRILISVVAMLAAAALALVAPSSAAPMGKSGPIQVTVGKGAGKAVPNSVTLKDTVVCTAKANPPTKSHISGSEYAIVGVGAILSCSPHAPYTCSITTEVQYEQTNAGGIWYPAGPEVTTYGCPPPAKTSTSSYTCTSSASETVNYRTFITITTVYGTTSTSSGPSAVSTFACV